MWSKGNSYAAGGDINSYNYFSKVSHYLFKWKLHISYDPAILLLDTHPTEMLTYMQQETWRTKLTAAHL